MRTRTPEQHEADYRWLTPSEAMDLIGVDSVEMVRELIRDGHLKAIDVSRSTVPRYKVSPDAIAEFLAESRRRVTE